MKVVYLFNRQSLKWIIGGIACCLVLSIAWAAYRYETGHQAKPPSHFESNLSAVGPSMAIRGFTFDGNHEGRRTLSIKADSFIVDKKKIGFFRCGLMNTAKLNNAVIDIYAAEATASHPQSHSTHKNTLNGTMQRIVSRWFTLTLQTVAQYLSGSSKISFVLNLGFGTFVFRI